MNTPATSPSSKRVRFSGKLTKPKVSSDLPLKPADAAKSCIAQGLASLPPNFKSFFSPLCIDLLDSRLKKTQKYGAVKLFEDPEFLPRSIRIKVDIGFSKDIDDDNQAQLIRDSMQLATVTFQTKARALILQAALMEIDVIENIIGDKYIAMLIHIVTVSLVQANLSCEDAIISGICHYALDTLDIRDHILALTLCHKRVAERYPAAPVNVHVNNFPPGFFEKYKMLLCPINGSIAKFISITIQRPWKEYLDTCDAHKQNSALRLYFKKSSVMTATEETIIRMDTEPDSREGTLNDIVNSALGKQAKQFERRQKSIENTLKQLTSNRKTKNVTTGGSKATASEKKTAPQRRFPRNKT